LLIPIKKAPDPQIEGFRVLKVVIFEKNLIPNIEEVSGSVNPCVTERALLIGSILGCVCIATVFK